MLCQIKSLPQYPVHILSIMPFHGEPQLYFSSMINPLSLNLKKTFKSTSTSRSTSTRKLVDKHFELFMNVFQNSKKKKKARHLGTRGLVWTEIRP